MKSIKEDLGGQAKVFVLSSDGNISVFASVPEAQTAMACGDSLFEGFADLKDLMGQWPIARLVRSWNSIPGVAPIRKFSDRTTGVKRIWSAIQTLEPVRGQQDDELSPPISEDRGKVRSGTKKAALLALLARDGGATVREIMAELGWQSHSVRGCLSSLSRKGLRIHSFRRSSGERAYSTSTSAESGKEGAQ